MIVLGVVGPRDDVAVSGLRHLHGGGWGERAVERRRALLVAGTRGEPGTDRDDLEAHLGLALVDLRGEGRRPVLHLVGAQHGVRVVDLLDPVELRAVAGRPPQLDGVGGDGFRDELDRRLGRHLRGAGAHHVAGLPPRDDQTDDRGHQEDGERDHALGQDRQVLDRAVEHRPARVGDAGPSHRRARRTGVRHRPRRLADHLERPAHGRAAQERVARADPQPRRRRTADRNRELFGLHLEAQRLLVVLDREAQVDG